MKGLGKRIKEVRKVRGLTLVQVARQTGIDQATLSRIENERMTGTLDSHMRIAEALGLRLPELYNQVVDTQQRAREKTVQQKLETFSHSSGAVAQLLTTGILQKKMLPLVLRIKPGGHTETEECQAGSERFVYVLKGSVAVHAGDARHDLAQGAHLYFDASLPHHFKNTAKTESACLSVMTPTSL